MVLGTAGPCGLWLLGCFLSECGNESSCMWAEGIRARWLLWLLGSPGSSALPAPGSGSMSPEASWLGAPWAGLLAYEATATGPAVWPGWALSHVAGTLGMSMGLFKGSGRKYGQGWPGSGY